MEQQLIDVGDRLVSVTSEGHTYRVGKHAVMSIGVQQLPGPMGFYLVANIIFESDAADMIVPLHSADRFEVLNP